MEIIQDDATGRYKGEFVTMMQASHRAKGIQSKLNTSGKEQAIIKTDYGESWRFVMALHRNDLVSVCVDPEKGNREFYRVQKLESPGGLTLRLHTASTLNNKNEELRLSISTLMKKNVVKHRINAIGIISDD